MKRVACKLAAVMAMSLTALFLAPGTVRADSDIDSAAVFLSAFIDDAVGVLSNDGLSDELRLQEFRRLFRAGFDVDVISRFVLGRFWRVATAEEKEEYRAMFEDYVLATYARRLGGSMGINVAVGGARALSDRGAIVNSQILLEKQEPVDVEWRLRRTADSWRIVDIVIIGVSMAVTQRSEFASVINNNGGKVEALLKALRSRIAGKDDDTS